MSPSIELKNGRKNLPLYMVDGPMGDVGVMRLRHRVRYRPEGCKMTGIVIEHVPVAELPLAWREKLGQVTDGCVTVRIDAEGDQAEVRGASEFAEDPLFGMWRDRQDIADVGRYVREIRASRFNRDGSRNES